MHIISTIFLFLTFLYSSTATTTASLNTQQQVVLLTRVVSDIRSYPTDYINFFETNDKIGIPFNLVGALNQINTYTDDSYTSIIENSIVMQQIENIATQLPWYNQRIANGNDVASLTTSTTNIETTSDSDTTNEAKSNPACKIGVKLFFGVLSGILVVAL